MTKNTVILIIVAILSSSFALLEGEFCTKSESNEAVGLCLSLSKCEHARKLLRTQRVYPRVCGFNGTIPLVCCPKPVKLRQSAFHKSEEQCRYYYGLRGRRLIAAGEEAGSREFPHMAALGYGLNQTNVQWLCGGTLISNDFVLTAAHCIENLNFGDPKWVRLGDLNLNVTNDDAKVQDIKISKLFVHPDYKPPSHYNDIALLKLQNPANFTGYVQPACLYIKEDSLNRQLQAIGWGKTNYFGDTSNHLMKVFLNIIEHKKCAAKYSNVSHRKLPRGILDESQICAGDSTGKDTCPGDSGGPLHFLEETIGNYRFSVLSHFVVVGVTSFGKGCGTENSVGVYTRVSAYRSWIEDIVWPADSSYY